MEINRERVTKHTPWPKTRDYSTAYNNTSFALLTHLRLEPSATDPEGTVVVEVPVDAGEGVRTARDLTMWEQLSFAAFLQRYWADNQASTFQLLRKTPVPSRVRTKYVSGVELARSLPRIV